tara:strand:+ start:4896 stop:5945 length:1050 start_codon:yes stop_codon:yes gene_type:complete
MKLKEKIIELINNTDKKISYKSCLIIYGNSGIGKTYNIYKICNELELNIINITITNVSSSIEFEDILFKSVTTINFMDLMLNNMHKKKIIIIDNYEVLLSIDRTINNTLFNILSAKKFKNIAIICICNKDLLKKLGNIKKKCEIIEYNLPSYEEISKILLEKNHNLNNTQIKKIIIDSNYNIQQCLFILDKFYNNSNINLHQIDKSVYIEYLYSDIIDRDIIKKILLTESWLIPLRFHENLIIELKNRKTSLQNKNEYYINFLYNLCIFDVLMGNNVIDSAIDIITSEVIFLSMLPLKKKAVSNLNNFTKLLSYLSLQKKNIKKGFSFNNQFYHIGNYHINSININLYS